MKRKATELEERKKHNAHTLKGTTLKTKTRIHLRQHCCDINHGKSFGVWNNMEPFSHHLMKTNATAFCAPQTVCVHDRFKILLNPSLLFAIWHNSQMRCNGASDCYLPRNHAFHNRTWIYPIVIRSLNFNWTSLRCADDNDFQQNFKQT